MRRDELEREYSPAAAEAARERAAQAARAEEEARRRRFAPLTELEVEQAAARMASALGARRPRRKRSTPKEDDR